MSFSLILVFIAAIIGLFYIYNKKYYTLPGPWNLPIVGSLYLLDPNEIHVSLVKLAQKYGRIFSLKFGSMNVVMIADPRLVKKILLKNESVGRPSLYILDYVFRDKGIVWARNDLWKDQRKFVTNFLRTSGASKISSKKKLFENYIQTNIQELVEYIKNKGDRVTMIPADHFQHCMNNISSSLIFGKSWSRGDEKWRRFTHFFHQLATTVAVSGPLNFFPVLRFLPRYRKLMKTVTEVYNGMHEMQNEIIDDIKKNFNDKESEATNLINAFLLQKSKIYNIDQLRSLAIDVFGASVETTVNWVLWTIYYLTVHQEVQDKVRQELNDVLQNKTIEYEDIANLPYVEATLAESTRIRSLVHSGFPHCALEDIWIEDIKIPKGTMIIALIWAIHMNPEYWKNPEKFCPERFLTEEGKFFQPEAFIPFQPGKRVCPGEEFAKIVGFLFVSTIVKNFKITSDKPIDLTGVSGLTLASKPQELIFEKL